MNLVGKTVRFYLLPQGRKGLQPAVSLAGEYIDGVVADENHLGVWISVPELESPIGVVLLRWDYFSTALLDYEPGVPLERPPVGFRPS